MNWRQRGISVVVLAVLTGLPVGGSVCAVLCRPAPAATLGASSNAARCHEQPAAAQVYVAAVSKHDCGTHDGRVRERAATLTAKRADAGVLFAPIAASAAYRPFEHVPAFQPDFAYSPPADTSKTSTPPVLRV